MKLSQFLESFDRFWKSIVKHNKVTHESGKPQGVTQESANSIGQEWRENKNLVYALYYMPITLEIDDDVDWKSGLYRKLWLDFEKQFNLKKDPARPHTCKVLIKFDVLFDYFLQFLNRYGFQNIKHDILQYNNTLERYCYGEKVDLHPDDKSGDALSQRCLSLDDKLMLFRAVIRTTYANSKIKIYDHLAKDTTFLNYFLGKPVDVDNEKRQISEKVLLENFNFAILAARRGDRLGLFKEMFFDFYDPVRLKNDPDRLIKNPADRVTDSSERLKNAIMNSSETDQTELLVKLVNKITFGKESNTPYERLSQKLKRQHQTLIDECITPYLSWVNARNIRIIYSASDHLLGTENKRGQFETRGSGSDPSGFRKLQIEVLTQCLPDEDRQAYLGKYEKIFIHQDRRCSQLQLGQTLTGRKRKHDFNHNPHTQYAHSKRQRGDSYALIQKQIDQILSMTNEYKAALNTQVNQSSTPNGLACTINEFSFDLIQLMAGILRELSRIQYSVQLVSQQNGTYEKSFSYDTDGVGLLDDLSDVAFEIPQSNRDIHENRFDDQPYALNTNRSSSPLTFFSSLPPSGNNTLFTEQNTSDGNGFSYNL